MTLHDYNYLVRVKLFDSVNKAKETLANNQPRLVRLGSTEICIVRKNDSYYAFQNACTHLGEQLHKGITNHLNEIICPLHSFRFNMITGEETERRCKSLLIYQVEINSDGVFIIG